jgi:hypothetical protein
LKFNELKENFKSIEQENNALQEDLQKKHAEIEQLKKDLENEKEKNEQQRKDLQSKTKFGTKKMSPIQNFFISCSGANKEIMKECSIEWNKYVGIGATLFFIGVLAILSGGYAFYTFFQNTNLDVVDIAFYSAIFLGLLLGVIIFFLDRLMISTLKKSNNENIWKRLGNELLQVLSRIIFVIIIAIVISIPIQIKIFENQLSELMQSKGIDFSNNFITRINAIEDLIMNNTTMWWISLIITLLFITIILMPVLIRLITKRGVYDETLDRIEYENVIEQKSKIAHKNPEINQQL